MKIKFRGKHTKEEAMDSVLSVLQMFEDRYGINNFEDIECFLTLQDNRGEEVEIVDMATEEVLETFEVIKASDIPKPALKLVVDNTGHKSH